jgi:hypothetical protein
LGKKFNFLKKKLGSGEYWIVLAREMAVTGWQWYQSKAQISAVQMVVKWYRLELYWPSYGCLDCDVKKIGRVRVRGVQGRQGGTGGWLWGGEWQWLGGSNTNREIRSVRSFWW